MPWPGRRRRRLSARLTVQEISADGGFCMLGLAAASDGVDRTRPPVSAPAGRARRTVLPKINHTARRLEPSYETNSAVSTSSPCPFQSK
jgi:hypothetical protein